MDRIYVLISTWLGPLRGRIMVAFVLIVGMYFVLSFGEQAWRARELEDDVAQRRAEIAELVAHRESLEEQILTYNGEQYETYVAQIARRDLNLSYPGETVVLMRWNQTDTEPEIAELETGPHEPTPNWRQWLDFIW